MRPTPSPAGLGPRANRQATNSCHHRLIGTQKTQSAPLPTCLNRISRPHRTAGRRAVIMALRVVGCMAVSVTARRPVDRVVCLCIAVLGVNVRFCRDPRAEANARSSVADSGSWWRRRRGPSPRRSSSGLHRRLERRHATAFASRATASATGGPNMTSSLWLAPRITTRSTRVGASSATRALSSVGMTASRSP
jgi:hypothetical protein